MADNDKTVVDNLSTIQLETAEHIGDLYEKAKALQDEITGLTGATSGTSLQDTIKALEAAKQAAAQAVQAATESTSLSNQALEKAQSVTDEAKLVIANATLLDSESSDSSFFDTEYIQTAPAIAVETRNNVRGFYRLVRDFVIKAKPWTEAIRYFTKPDERYDLTKVSRRIYGNPDEFIAIMAAANLDSVENVLEPQALVLPTASQLNAMKLKAGYRNTSQLRLS